MQNYVFSSPIEVNFHLTHTCNLRCVHCYLNAGDQSERELTSEEMNIVLDRLIDMKTFKIYLTGGEPMLRTDFFDIIKKLHRKMWMTLSTNGTLINEYNVEEVTKYIKEFAISIDGATAETHDQFRRFKGSFYKVIKAIKYINNTGDKNVVFIRTTLGKHNVNEIDDVIDMAISLNVRGIRFSTLYPKGRAIEHKHLFFDNYEIKNVITRILDRKKKLGVKNNIVILFDDSLQIPLKLFGLNDTGEELVTMKENCGAGNYMFSIMPNGDIFPCEFFQESSEFLVGNALRDDMTKLWKESKILNDVRNGIESPGMCKSCKFEEKCLTIRCPALILTRGYWCNWYESEQIV